MVIEDARFKDLLAAARARDASAFNELWASLREGIRERAAAAVNGKLSRRIDASDITQDASLTVWSCLTQFQGDSPSAFIAWSLAILRSERSREVEWHGAGKRAISRDAAPPAGGDGEPTWGVVSDPRSETPSVALSHDEEWSRIAAAIGRIASPRQREAVRLKYLERKTEPEIALAMQLSRPTVSGLIARGTQSLRELLGSACAS